MREVYEAIVGTNVRRSERKAIAHATQALANPEKGDPMVSESFTRGTISDINVYGGKYDQKGVGITFSMEDPDAELIEKIEQHPDVETVEGVSVVETAEGVSVDPAN